MNTLDVSTLALIATRGRFNWISAGNLDSIKADAQRYAAYGTDFAKMGRAEDFQQRVNTLIAEEYIISDGDGYFRDMILSDRGAEVVSEPLDMTSLIDYKRENVTGITDAEYEFRMWGWSRILSVGEEYEYLGGGSVFGERLTLFHLITCGVNGSKSSPPVLNSWSTFNGTYAESDYERKVFRAIMSCRCGEVNDLDIGDEDSLSIPEMFERIKEASRQRRGFRS